MKNLLAFIAVFFVCFGLSIDDADARRGGGSRSSFSRSSSRSSSSSRSVSRPKASTSRPKANLSSSRPSSSSKSTKSSTDKRAYEKAKSNGKAFTSKSAAKKDFQSKIKSDPKAKASFAKQYPTKYNKEPTTRPSHIPQSYQGSTVIYQNGGYGYMNNGAFTMLSTMMLMDTMSDAMMMNAMQRQGYYIGAPPVVHAANTGSSVLSVVCIFLLIVIVGIIIVAVYETRF